MKRIEVELPDSLARQVELLVERGWFVNEADIARHALRELIKHHRFELQEQFQREDVQWALGLKTTRA